MVWDLFSLIRSCPDLQHKATSNNEAFFISLRNDICRCRYGLYQRNILIHRRSIWKMFCGALHIGSEHKTTAWWRHQMETFSALLAICAGNSPVPGEIPAQRPVTRSFDVFFDLRLNEWLSKQSWGWWFETLSCQLWLHCNGEIRRIDLRREQPLAWVLSNKQMLFWVQQTYLSHISCLVANGIHERHAVF